MNMTIKEVAMCAGVSTATVSYVINGTKNVKPETRKRVLEAIAQSGYQPNQIAKSLRIKNTSTIGVVVEDIRCFPVPDIINGISEHLEVNGYRILLNDLRMHESLLNQYGQLVKQKDKINDAISLLLFGAQVDAVIYVAMSDREITGIINEIDKPLVIAYSTTADPGVCYVTYDNEHISADVVRILFNYGHRRIAIITGPIHISPTRARMRGIERAFKEAGIVLDNALVREGDWEYDSGYFCMKELLEQEPQPTALFAMNDSMAAGAMDAIQDAGMTVPRDISIIGFDNREIASYLRPRLTTVGIDLKGIGRTAGEMILKQIQGGHVGERKAVLPSKLVQRNTVSRLHQV